MKLRTGILCLAVGLSAQVNASLINVAIIGDSSNNSNVGAVASQLNDSNSFDYNALVITQNSISSAADLSGFDAVILGGSGNTTNGYSNTVLSSVSDFMSLGNGVVTSGWWDFSTISYSGATEAHAEAISPITTQGNSYDFRSGATTVITDPNHFITAGINDFVAPGCCTEVGFGIDIGATQLATTNNGGVAVAYQEVTGRSVYLGNLYMGADSYGASVSMLRTPDSDGDRLFEQAVAWAASGQTVTDVPEPSTLAIFALGMIGLASRRFKK